MDHSVPTPVMQIGMLYYPTTTTYHAFLFWGYTLDYWNQLVLIFLPIKPKPHCPLIKFDIKIRQPFHVQSWDIAASLRSNESWLVLHTGAPWLVIMPQLIWVKFLRSRSGSEIATRLSGEGWFSSVMLPCPMLNMGTLSPAPSIASSGLCIECKFIVRQGHHQDLSLGGKFFFYKFNS